jgi:hypothetical protein
MSKRNLSPQEWRKYLIDGVSKDPKFQQNLIEEIQKKYTGDS